MDVPGWYPLLLLAGASYRTWRLLALDAVLDSPRTRLILGDRDEDGDPVAGDGYRAGLDDFMQCPWCLGFWVSVVWFGAWEVRPHFVTVLAAAATIALSVGLLHRFDPPD